MSARGIESDADKENRASGERVSRSRRSRSIPSQSREAQFRGAHRVSALGLFNVRRIETHRGGIEKARPLMELSEWTTAGTRHLNSRFDRPRVPHSATS